MHFEKLCEVADLEKGRNQLEASGVRYLVTVSGASIDVYSGICPHQGGKVCLKEGEYVCPLHNWKFESTGECKNAKNERLLLLSSKVENGVLFVEEQPLCKNDFLVGKEKLAGVEIKLLAHACIELKVDGLTILTDPWLDGPAFFGSWIQYPKYPVNISDLQPDVIVISHEHSDHFHPETLAQFSRDVPIVFPAFANARMEQTLIQLGFSNIFPVPFGVSHSVSALVNFTFFEPTSVWNDSIVLLQTSAANILNLNDAGLNYKIRKDLPQIDLVLCEFNAGASGYPSTWRNVSLEDKKAFWVSAVFGKMEMLKQVMEMYGAKFLLPFASFFRLWTPEHRKFMEMAVFTPPFEVKKNLSTESFEVLDLLPGDSWDGHSSVFTRFRSEAGTVKAYDKESTLKFLAREHEKKSVAPDNGNDKLLDPQLVLDYFQGFNYSPEISHCEDLAILLTVKSVADHQHFKIKVDKSRLSISQVLAPCSYELLIIIPAVIFNDIVSNNESWDEVTIGYWCEFDRNPDVYHGGFWRMIQAPYYLKPVMRSISDAELRSMPLEYLVDSSTVVDKVMRRYGMYCLTCPRKLHETLDMAIKYHGLNSKLESQLLNELKFIIQRTIEVRTKDTGACV